jgi:Undecaprenyl-phosphate glucose phosphotransferase
MSSSLESLDLPVKLARRPAGLSPGVLAGLVAAADACATVLTGLLLALLLGRGMGDQLTEVAAMVSLAAVLVVLGGHAAGLYRFPALMGPLRHLRRILTVCAVVFLIPIALAFALKVSSNFSRVWTFSWLLCFVASIVGIRFFVANALRRLAAAGRISRKIVVFGGHAHGENVIRRIEGLAEPWNRIVGVFDDRLSRVGPTVGGYPVLGNLTDLVKWSRGHQPDEILVALPWGAETRLVHVFKCLEALPANVRLCAAFTRPELSSGRINYQFGIPMLNAYEKPMDGWGVIVKRAFDVVFAGSTVILAMPLLLLIALCIRLESRGPIFFRQPRYGFNNELVDVFKFRTMVADASDTLGERLTARHDGRVTRVGAILRRFSLDELPQLINVMRGEMSVVGPRPHAVKTTAGNRQCGEVIDEYAVRHKVKPGITGWAQVNGWRGTMEDEQHLLRRLEHDLYYIKNWSLLLDVKIIVLTPWTIVLGRNSF